MASCVAIAQNGMLTDGVFILVIRGCHGYTHTFASSGSLGLCAKLHAVLSNCSWNLYAVSLSGSRKHLLADFYKRKGKRGVKKD